MTWTHAYRAYDDDTLATLANAGLLRRAAKDVEAGKVQWQRQGEADGVRLADGQQVQLDARGPQKAQCDCPAPGLCKHILAAALWLRALPEVAADTQAPAVAPAGVAPPDASAEASAPLPPLAQIDPLAEVLALDSAALFKAAGVAAQRRAWQALPCGVEWRVQGSALVMDLPALGVSCRWVAGAGFEGMVSEVPARERRAVHLIALAAVRSAAGRPLSWPSGQAPQPAPDVEAPRPVGASERAFVFQVQALLGELLRGGLSHVSRLSSAQLLALNMSARGEGLPRLAALLRNLAGTVDALERRDHRTLEADALALMARTHALCVALTAPDTAPDATPDMLALLRGRVRRDFDDIATLALLPLGAYWWQTLGGARGLTLGLWDVDGQRLLQATLARPDGSDPGFSRHTAWATLAVWPGVGSAHRLCQAPLQLEQPRLADDGRLAVGGASRASAIPAWRAEDPRLATLGYGRWADLREPLQAATGLGGEPVDMLLLRPSRTHAPVLDETRQQLHWALQDDVGQWLRLTVPVSDETALRLDNLDRLTARQAPIHAVLVRVERTGAETLLVPVAVLSSGVSAGSSGDTLQAVSLDFATEPARPTPLAQRMLRLMQWRKEQQAAPALAQPTLAQRLLQPVMTVLETQAATGRMALTGAQRDVLTQAHAALASVGLRALEAALHAHLQAPSSDSLLPLACLAQWAQELDGLPLCAESDTH